MIETREPSVVPDTAADPGWVPLEGWEWLRSYVAAPIQVAGLVVGFLNVDGAQPGQFSVADASRLQAFANHAATAIENARLYHETAHRLAQTQVLREMMLAAASTLDFDQVLQQTMETLRATMKVEFIGCMLPDEEGVSLRPHPSQIGYDASAGQTSIPLDESVCGRVFQTGEPMVIGDVDEFAYSHRGHPTARSQVAVPVRVGEHVIGVLSVGSAQPNAFGTDDLAFYTAIAGQLGLALDNARLYQELQHHAGELAAALAQAHELERLKSEFIQNVSHELRLPLALVQGYAALLVGGELGELSAEQQGALEILARRSQMLSDLVEDITLILGAETRPLARGPVALDELVHLSVEEFRAAAERGGLTLTAGIAPDVPSVGGEAIYLRRVLDNLLSNAVKFTPSGGTINVQVRQDDDQVILQVSDTGVGIPHDEQERIFDRFYQVDGSVRRRHGGVGLGLALVKEVVEVLGGEVSVESEVGQGSTFTVILPMAEEQEMATATGADRTSERS